MRYLGLIITALLLSATSMFAGSETLTAAATTIVWSTPFSVARADTLYTAGQAIGSISLVGLDVELEVAASAAGPWIDTGTVLLDFADAAGPPFDETLEDPTRALTGELYVRYKVDNTTAASIDITLWWDSAGEKDKHGIGGSKLRAFKSSVGATADLTIVGTTATSAAVYARGYDQVVAYYGDGTGNTGTITLWRAATRDGPWFTTGVTDAWVADTEEFVADAVADGAHYYRAELTAGTADDVVALKLHPR